MLTWSLLLLIIDRFKNKMTGNCIDGGSGKTFSATCNSKSSQTWELFGQRNLNLRNGQQSLCKSPTVITILWIVFKLLFDTVLFCKKLINAVFLINYFCRSVSATLSCKSLLIHCLMVLHALDVKLVLDFNYREFAKQSDWPIFGLYS